MHTTHTSRSHSRSGSHVSHREVTRKLQLEIDHLRRKLHRKKMRNCHNLMMMTVIDPDQEPLLGSLSFMNEALMCKVFPSSLRPVAMRWFDGLKEGSINSFQELSRAFGIRFVTCSRVPRPLDSLVSMTMREGETLKTYFDRYWEMFNKIDEDFEDVAVKTFKVGILAEHELRKSWTKKPVQSMRQLMDWIDKHKRVEDDQQQAKGKAKEIPHDQIDFRSERYNSNQPKRDFTGHTGQTTAQVVNTVFREPVHQILEKIKNEPYFKWPNKMGGDPIKRNQSLLCQYHQDRGHTTEDCRTLCDYLEQLVKIGKLKQFLYQPFG